MKLKDRYKLYDKVHKLMQKGMEFKAAYQKVAGYRVSSCSTVSSSFQKWRYRQYGILSKIQQDNQIMDRWRKEANQWQNTV